MKCGNLEWNEESLMFEGGANRKFHRNARGHTFFSLGEVSLSLYVSGAVPKHPPLGGFQCFPVIHDIPIPRWPDLALPFHVTPTLIPCLSPVGSLLPPSNSASGTGSLGVLSGLGCTLPLPCRALFTVLLPEDGRGEKGPALTWCSGVRLQCWLLATTDFLQHSHLYIITFLNHC